MTALKYFGLWCFGSFVWFGVPITGLLFVLNGWTVSPMPAHRVAVAGMIFGAIYFSIFAIGEWVEEAPRKGRKPEGPRL